MNFRPGVIQSTFGVGGRDSADSPGGDADHRMRLAAMHEYSVARSLIREVERIVAAEAMTSRVIEVRVQVGEFSGVDAELLGLAFERLAPASRACGARLLVHRSPLRAACGECGRTFGVVDFRFECPDCASREVSIVAGEELLLDAVTMETEA